VISGKIAKTVFDEMAQTGKAAQQIVEEKGLVQISDTDAIEEVVANVISNNPKEAEGYKNGKTKLLGFFVGQVMRETKGKANPKLVNDILKRKME
jgi:aspartyl-tRNA(Asn)/glutamyl-tRNA(Gln) amidotransferase subunit B